MFKKISKGDKEVQHKSLLDKQMEILRILKENPSGLTKGFLWRESRKYLTRTAYETSLQMGMSTKRIKYAVTKDDKGRRKSVYLITDKGVDILKSHNS